MGVSRFTLSELSVGERAELWRLRDDFNRASIQIWILLALSSGAKNSQEIAGRVAELTISKIQLNNVSLYRILRRFEDRGLVAHEKHHNKYMATLKVYSLTVSGRKVLRGLIENGVSDIWRPETRELITRLNSVS